MRWLVVTILGLTLATAARAEDIVDVLRRSQQTRLDAMAAANDASRAQVVQHSFEVLRQALAPLPPIDFHVISGSTMAETLHGHIIVANQSLADLPEGERLFVLAHEIGHVQQHHWLQMGLVYKRWVPGEVTPENTDPVAGMLGREASGLAHRQEFEADAFALQTLHRLGLSSDVAFSSLRMLGLQQDTATHPGTRKRLASLRATPSSD
jgi:Zn-dependent protease with chaperone function